MHASLYTAALDNTWAIRPQWLQVVLQTAKMPMDPKEMKRSGKMPRVDGPVAMIPLIGMITQRGSIWDEWFGGTSTQAFEAAFQRAMNNELIKAVVIDCDSPGGVTAGVSLASDRVFAARGLKPMVAVANSMACSAAYWIASSAEKFVAAPGSRIGSIGVYRMHEDDSKMLEMNGIKMTMMGMPEYKTEGNPYEPITEDCIEHNMACVEETYGMFAKAVARNRGVSLKDVNENFGKGRDYPDKMALQMGMIDRIASMDQVLRELGVGSGTSTLTRAQVEAVERELCEAWTGGVVEEAKRSPTRAQRQAVLLREREALEAGGWALVQRFP